MLAPHAPIPALLIILKGHGLCRPAGYRIYSFGETLRWLSENLRKRPVELMHDIGLFERHVLGAHMVGK